ncbi:hypothetical protein SAMN05216369_2916 [Marinobacter antarcticus]|uniref:Uncharacterized protein n=1 Tax=Marinobacter antarcticus TaxID=564117 RepID=A0A1M6UUF6_9GAMM|nr:hypothetical protein [Marinobacter antarcticus]SHK72859.1 hypothetical protein SAMN05216369_2916 [Marinobacter antarcticus]
MNRLICLPVSVLFLTIAGCGKESDELPVDGRDFESVPSGVYARVDYRYKNLSEYFVELLE